MSKVKATDLTDTVASTLTSLADQIKSAVLSKAERRILQNRNERTPDALVEMLIHLAEQNGGQILGMSFDAATARATLAQTSASQTQIRVARQLLQRMEDDMIQQRATLADQSFAIYTALRRLVGTKAGNFLAPAYEQMKSIVKNRPRKRRAKKPTAKAPGTEVTASSSTEASADPKPEAQTAATQATVANTSK